MTTRPFPLRAASRWTALAAAAVALLFAATVQAAEKNPEYTSLAGVTSEGIQKWIEDAKSQGYVPIYLNGCSVGDHAEFSGVAVKDSTPRQWEYRINITADEFKQYFDEMIQKGFRPVGGGYMAGKGLRFAVAWVKDNDKQRQDAKINMTREQFESTVADMRKGGMDPHFTSAYQGADGTVRYFATFTERHKGATWDEQHELTADDYQDQLDKWSSKGYQLSSMHVYDTPKGLRYMATAVKAEDNPFVWKERHGLIGDEYQKAFEKLGEDGYRPRSICEYRDDGHVRFAVVWVKRK